MSKLSFASYPASLLLALGLVASACGGTTRESLGDENGGAGGTTTTPPAPAGSGGTTTAPPAPAGSGGTTTTPPAPASTTPQSTCTSPVVDAVTGLVKCAEGFEHREAAKACNAAADAAPSDPGAGPSPQPLPRADNTQDCKADATSCGGFQYGYCDHHASSGTSWAYCSSGCVTDADCGNGYLCICGHSESPTGGACVAARCRSDADCGASLCLPNEDLCGAKAGFSCQTPWDQCRSDAECKTGQHCTWGANHPVGGGSNIAYESRACTGNTC